MSTHKFEAFCRALPTMHLLGVVDFYAQRRETHPRNYRIALRTASERGIY